jgi:photosystem II stability/assembly factor-like uncharacterized protein
MKRISFFLIAISLLGSCSKNDNSYPITPAGSADTLTAGWSLSAGPANAGKLTDIRFSDPLHGYTTGTAGIYKTTDGGNTWTTFSTAANYFSIGGIGSNATFVNGSNTILNTLDGTTLTPATYTLAQGFTNCFYPNPNACLAINSNSVWKSSSGGAAFNLIYTFPSSYAGNSVIMFTDELEGFAARGTALYSTYNGGFSWVLVHTAESIITSVLDQNGSYVYYTTGTGLFKSFNGGGTWSSVLQYPLAENANIEFVNSTLLYLSAGSVIYKSTDGGNTWSKVVSLGPGKSILKVYFNDLYHGWACGNFGVLKFSN